MQNQLNEKKSNIILILCMIVLGILLLFTPFFLAGFLCFIFAIALGVNLYVKYIRPDLNDTEEEDFTDEGTVPVDYYQEALQDNEQTIEIPLEQDNPQPPLNTQALEGFEDTMQVLKEKSNHQEVGERLKAEPASRRIDLFAIITYALIIIIAVFGVLLLINLF